MSRSMLFLMEQIIVITIFAICVAVCVRILVESYMITTDAVDTKNALLAAESAAESHRAFFGDTERIANILGGSVSGNSLSIYFDDNWQAVSAANASFVLHLEQTGAEVLFSDITVTRLECGSELIGITTAARRAEDG